VMIDLGTLGGRRSQAIAINDRGQVVGWSTLAGDTNLHAFIWEDGVMTDLGSLPGTSSSSDPAAISRRGAVAGNTNTRVGFYWAEGVMLSLGTLGGPATSAYDVNDRRQVVGVSTLDTGEAHAVLWDDGELIDLGTLPGGNNSDALAINRRGQIVGQSNSGSSPSLAVLWTRH